MMTAPTFTGEPSGAVFRLIRPEKACATVSVQARSRKGPVWPKPEIEA